MNKLLASSNLSRTIKLNGAMHLLLQHTMVVLALLLACLSDDAVLATGASSFLYESQPLCGVQERIAGGCLTLGSTGPMTAVQCALLCRQETPWCQSIVFDDVTGLCYFPGDCDVNEFSLQCAARDATFRHYRLTVVNLPPGTCLNGAIYSNLVSKCICNDNWVGPHCERRPYSCQELRELNYTHGYHVMEMSLLGQTLTTTRLKCSFDANTVRTYISVSNGHADFNRTFQEYQRGFHLTDEAYWLGLDLMHAMSNADGFGTLVLETQINGRPLRTDHRNAVIGGVASDYEMNFDSVILKANDYHVTVEECVRKGTKFSTWDRDNDLDPEINLSLETGTGWWFSDLLVFCNPNGKAPTATSPEGLEYVNIRGINLTFSGYGQYFDYVGLYFLQTNGG